MIPARFEHLRVCERSRISVSRADWLGAGEGVPGGRDARLRCVAAVVFTELALTGVRIIDSSESSDIAGSAAIG